MKDQERVLEALLRTSRALAAELDLEKLMQLLTDEATRLCGAQIGAFFCNHTAEGSERYMLYTTSGLERSAFEQLGMPRSTEMLEPTFSGGAVLRVADITRSRRRDSTGTESGEPAEGGGVRSYLAAPVVSPRGDVHGGLFFGHTRPDVFREVHERLIEAVAAQAAVAIDNARLYEAVLHDRDQQARRARLAEQLGLAVTGADPIEVKLARCVETIVEQLAVAFCGIWAHDSDEGPLELFARAGSVTVDDALLQVSLGERDIGWIAAHGTPLTTNDPFADPERSPAEWARREGITALAGYPLSVQGRVLGVMAVYARQPFTESSWRVLSSAADHVALALDAARVERQRESFRDVFIWMLGHDLRNPLNAISIGAQILTMSKELPDRCVRIARNVQASTQRMGRMVTQLLDFARMRAAGDAAIPIHRTRFDVRQACTGALRELRDSFPDREVVEFYKGDTVGCWDADRIGQLFATLIGNALRHGDPDQAVALRVWRDGSEIVAQVHNRGTPIPAAQLPSILDPFRRNGKLKTTGSDGLGLGLYVAHQIALAHGGNMAVTSSEQDGTTFEVRLPEASSDA